MHETAFAKKIIEEAEKLGDVRSINLELGELSAVPPEELLDCVKNLVKWDVNHTIKASKVECECGFRGRPTILERGHDFFFIECPKCQSIPKLVDGTDIRIVSVTLK